MNVINPGSTLMLKVNLNNILIDTVDSIQFYLSRTKDNNPTVTKTYKKDGSDKVQFNNGYFYVPFTQEDTLTFLGMKMVYFGIQINFINKSVSKIDYKIFSVQKTVGTEIIENNIPSIDTTESYIEADFDIVYVLNISKEELQSYVEQSKINADKALEASVNAANSKTLVKAYSEKAQTAANTATLMAEKTEDAKLIVENKISVATDLQNKAIEAATTAENAKNTVVDTANQVSADKEIVLNAKSDTLIAKQDTITAKNEAVAAKNDAITAKDTAVEQANSASLNKDKTDINVTTIKQLAEQVGTDKTEVSEMVTESWAILEEQRKLIGLMPTIYITQTIEEMRAIANPKEKDICFVLGDVQSAYMYYTTAIDGTALSNPTWVWLTDIQLVAPSKDYLLNILQLATVATTGSYTDLINKPKRYESFVIVDDGVWDYSAADKIKLTADLVSIGNVYNGAVGLIQTDLDITLPENSKKAYDYDYMDLPTGGMYQYTFLYDGSYYNWSRTVIA